MKLNILGTEYEIETHRRAEDNRLEFCDGYTDTTTKRIVVFDPRDETGSDCVDDMEYYKKKVLRHEIVHAALYESGLAENSDWAFKEEIVDWIAIQIPKLAKAMYSACTLDFTDIVDLGILNTAQSNGLGAGKGAGVDG